MAKRRKDTVVIPMHKEDTSGGGRIRVPETDYVLECVSVKHDTAKSSGNPMLVWKWKFAEGKYEGKEIVDRIVLIPKSLFMLRQVLEAMGKKVPSKAFNLNLKSLVGQEVGATIVDGEPYGDKGRISSEIDEYIDPDVARANVAASDDDEEAEDEDEEEIEDEDSEDEDSDDEDEDEEDEDEEDLEELDLEDL